MHLEVELLSLRLVAVLVKRSHADPTHISLQLVFVDLDTEIWRCPLEGLFDLVEEMRFELEPKGAVQRIRDDNAEEAGMRDVAEGHERDCSALCAHENAGDLSDKRCEHARPGLVFSALVLLVKVAGVRDPLWAVGGVGSKDEDDGVYVGISRIV